VIFIRGDAAHLAGHERGEVDASIGRDENVIRRLHAVLDPELLEDFAGLGVDGGDRPPEEASDEQLAVEIDCQPGRAWER
jgi:hypothetical protein